MVKRKASYRPHNSPERRAERIAAMSARVLAAWADAGPWDLHAGRQWYDRAHAAAAQLAADYGTTTEVAAGVIAALSPRCQWSANLVWAGQILAAVRAGRKSPPLVALGDNRRKAWRIVTGERPADVLRGPKVTRFFRNITGDNQCVTVDMWAALVAEGERSPRAPDRKRYDDIESAYVLASHAAGVSPRDLQATVWCAARGGAD